MLRHRNPLHLLLAGALTVVWTGAAPAGNPPEKADSTRVVVLGDDDEKVTLRFDGDQLVTVKDDNGKISTTMVDMQEIGHMVDGAISNAVVSLDDVLAELADAQFQVHLGRDNRLNLAYDDTQFEVDLDQIMTQVADAVQHGLAEIDVDRWCNSGPRGATPSEEELRQELDDLQREMKELRRELRRLQSGKDD